ncbi:MAG TPA: WYL domain-containing protein, partial [Arcobacter sp.]|nr:WYL domain-containing protein [Arcobacter sp.]
KLIFMERNWYLAYVDETQKCKFGRISFMDKIEYATKKEVFHLSSVTLHLKFLQNIQNSMTLYSSIPKTARLKAVGNAVKYFNKDMKPFFRTQKFEKTLDNGDILFTVEYTQELEILPFIQKWIPNIIVLEPISLKNKLEEHLHLLINRLN